MAKTIKNKVKKEKIGIVAEKEEVESKKSQAKEENKVLRNVLIGIGVVILLCLGIWFGQMERTFEFSGLEWNTISAGNIKFYHTSFNSTPTNTHNVYLRNDPRKLVEEIDFNGQVKIKKMAAMKGVGNFNCNGYGIVSQAELEQTLGAFNVSFIKDENATCDEGKNRYTFIEFVEGEETRIDQMMSDSCYKISVNNCDILKVKERFIVEILLETFG